MPYMQNILCNSAHPESRFIGIEGPERLTLSLSKGLSGSP